MYHRYAASKRTFMHVDHRIFQKGGTGAGDGTRTRAGSGSRRNTSSERVTATGDPTAGTLFDQKGQGWPIQLMEAAKVRIIRYVKIRSDVNPYDPKWELYLEARLGWQMSQTLAGRGRIEYLWKEQEGRCVVCGQPLRIAEEDLHWDRSRIRQRFRSFGGAGPPASLFPALRCRPFVSVSCSREVDRSVSGAQGSCSQRVE